MKHNHEYHKIVFEISDKEFEKHLNECPSCKELNSRVNDAMSILDNTIDIPEGMVEAVLIKKRELKIHKAENRKLSSYVQVAAVLLMGVFMGFMFGRNANASLFLSKESKKNKSLIEYYKSYNFEVKYSYVQF